MFTGNVGISVIVFYLFEIALLVIGWHENLVEHHFLLLKIEASQHNWHTGFLGYVVESFFPFGVSFACPLWSDGNL